MIELIRKTDGAPPEAPTVTLTLEQRSRSRLRVVLDDGRAAGILLPRGSLLREGDGLASAEGLLVRVCAAPESLSEARTADPLLLARACYHLGNRHVALGIEPGRLRYPQDPVLDRLVRGLGLQVQAIEAPFDPEPGAYGGHDHSHDRGAHGSDGQGHSDDRHEHAG